MALTAAWSAICLESGRSGCAGRRAGSPPDMNGDEPAMQLIARSSDAALKGVGRIRELIPPSGPERWRITLATVPYFYVLKYGWTSAPQFDRQRIAVAVLALAGGDADPALADAMSRMMNADLLTTLRIALVLAV